MSAVNKVIGVFAKTKYRFLLIGAVFLLLVIGLFFAFQLMSSNMEHDEVMGVEANSAKGPKISVPNSLKPNASGKPTEFYRALKESEDKKKVAAARNRKNAVAMRTGFGDSSSINAPGVSESILQQEQPCLSNCIIKDQQLIQALKRLGYSVKEDQRDDSLRLGNSYVFKNRTSQLVDALNQDILWDGKKVKVNEHGQLTDMQNNPILDDSNNIIYVDESGRFTGKYGEASQLNGRLTSKNGTIISNNGSLVTASSLEQINNTDLYHFNNKTLTTKDARKVKSMGLAVNWDKQTTALKFDDNEQLKFKKQNVYLTTLGKVVNFNGIKFKNQGILFSWDDIPIDSDGFLVRPLETLEQVGVGSFYKNSEGFLTNESGDYVLFNNQRVRYDEETGALVNDLGEVVRTSDGQVVRLSSDGDLIRDDGGLVEEPVLFNSENVAFNSKGDLITGDLVQIGDSDIFKNPQGYIFTKEGKRILSNGEQVKLDKNNRVLTSSGKNISSKGPIYLDERGNFVDINNKPILEDGLLVTQDGVAVSADGQILTSEDETEVLISDGAEVFFKGQKVVIDKKTGQLKTFDGATVKTKDGKAVFYKDGLIVDESNNLVNESLFVKPKALKVKQLLASDGSQLIIDGKKAYKRSDGVIVDDKGMEIKSPDGNSMLIENGVLVDSLSGKQLKGISLRSSKGKKEVNKGISLGRESVIQNSKTEVSKKSELRSTDGRQLYVAGKRAYKRSDGVLVDEYDNPILNEKGNPVKLNEKNEVIDSITKEKSNLEIKWKNGVSVPTDVITVGEPETYVKSLSSLETSSGESVLIDGKRAFVTGSGLVVDENNNPILKDGKRIYRRNGKFVSESGKEITRDLSLSTNKGRKISGSDVRKGSNYLLDPKSGKRIQFKNKDVVVRDGMLYTVDGQKVLNKKGEQLRLNKANKIVGKDGSSYKGNELFIKPELTEVNNSRLTTKKESSLKRIGNTDIYKSRNGLLTSKDGKALLHKGKPVRVGRNNVLETLEGEPILDRNNQPLVMGKDGVIRSIKGRQVKTGFLKTGDGIDITSAGNILKEGMLTRVGNSDMYTTADGKLVTKDGKSILRKGKEVFVGKGGVLLDRDKKPLTGEDGLKLLLKPDGTVMNKRGEISPLGTLTTSEGVLMTGKGVKISNTKDLTRIGNSNLFKTKDNRIVTADGKDAKINGQTAYLDGDQLRNRFGNQIRFNGSGLKIASTGQLLNENNEPVLNDHAEALFLDGQGNFINEEGSLENLSASSLDNFEPINTSDIRKSIDPNTSKIGPSIEEQVAAYNHAQEEAENTNTNYESESSSEDVSVSPKEQATNLIDAVDDQEVDNKGKAVQTNNESAHEPESKNKTLNAQAQQRVQERYNDEKERMELHLQEFWDSYEIKTAEANVQSFIYEDTSNQIEETSLTTLDEQEEISRADEIAGVMPEERPKLITRKNRMVLAQTIMSANSDYPGAILVELIGGQVDGARCAITPALIKGPAGTTPDRLIMPFDENSCDLNGQRISLAGVAIDPSSGYQGLASNVDYHWFFKYGSLALSYLGGGVSDAISESRTTEETTNEGGTRVTTTGLEVEEQILKAIGEAGRSASGLLAENVNRPNTVYVDAGIVFGVLLTENMLLMPKIDEGFDEVSMN